MKTIKESILSSTQSGKSLIYSVGKRIVDSDIPCTVVYSDERRVVLLSDVYGGKSGSNYVFKSNEDIDYHNMAYLEWEDAPKKKELPLSNGWDFPKSSIIDDCPGIKNNLNKLFNGYNVCTTFFVLMDSSYRSKKGIYFTENNSYFSIKSGLGFGIRFMKVIKL